MEDSLPIKQNYSTDGGVPIIILGGALLSRSWAL